jgi:hypothetical protein
MDNSNSSMKDHGFTTMRRFVRESSCVCVCDDGLYCALKLNPSSNIVPLL